MQSIPEHLPKFYVPYLEKVTEFRAGHESGVELGNEGLELSYGIQFVCVAALDPLLPSDLARLFVGT